VLAVQYRIVMSLAKPLLLVLFAVFLTGCSVMQPGRLAPDTTVYLTVLHTNDHHGRFWKNRDGEYGMAARKTVVDGVRAELVQTGGYVLLLDGGDVNTGVPESDLQDAVPDFKGMNLLGYDAMAVGNHEFDKSPAVLKMQRELANFPMLSANIYKRGERMFSPYRVFVVGGLRIGVMGLTTEDTQKMVHPDNVRDIEFRSPIEEARRLVPELRKHADVVIAATHMGHYQNGQHGTQAPGDVELVRAVHGIDLIVGGHTQNPACMLAENVIDRDYVPGSPCTPEFQNGSWIVQAHEWGKYVGRADFTYRNGVFSLKRYTLIPVNLQKPVTQNDGRTVMVKVAAEIPENRDMLTLLAPYQDFGQQKLLMPVGSTTEKFEGDRAMVRRMPTTLGTMVASAMQAKTRADFAIINAGGVRDSLPAGEVSYKDVLKVHPFGNTIVTVDMTSTDITTYLSTAIAMSPGSGAFAQYAGIRFQLEGSTPRNIHIGGQPLAQDRKYRMAVNSFMAAGGDGYPRLTNLASFVDTGFVDAEVLATFISDNSPLQPASFTSHDYVSGR
jgi:5'-nucleotidase/UDP-sugar diphosphatase